MAKKSACDAETVIFSFCTAAGFVLTLLTAWLLMKFNPKFMNDIGKTLGVVENFGETTITIPSLPKGAFGGMFGSDDEKKKGKGDTFAGGFGGGGRGRRGRHDDEEFMNMGGFMGFGKKDDKKRS